MKSNFRNALYNAIGFLLPVVITIFTTPYIVRKLTPEMYGIYVLAISLMGLMSFLDLGFGQGIIKYVSHYEALHNYERINRIIGISFLIYISMGLVGGLLIFLFSNILAKNIFHVKTAYIQTASISFKIVALGFFFNFVNNVFSNIPRALQRFDISVKIQNVIWLSSIISAVFLLWYGYGLNAILTSNLFFLMLGTILFLNASKKILPSFKIKLKFEKDVFKEIFGFSIYTSINSITGTIVSRVDKMLISGFLGTEAVTYYQIPFVIAQMANGFIAAISQFLFPSVSFINSMGEKNRLKEVFVRSMRYVVTLSLILISSIIFLGQDFLVLWMGKGFAEKSSYLIPILAIVFFFISVSTIAFWFFNGLGYSKVNMIFSLVGATAYLVAALFLIPHYKLKGAAIAFGFTLLPFPFYFYLIAKIIGEDFLWLLWISIKSIFVLTFILILKNLFSANGNILLFIMYEIFVLIFVIGSCFLLKIIYRSDVAFLLVRLRALKGTK
jgi:O-antigen/teichoic acid export membrane protein